MADLAKRKGLISFVFNAHLPFVRFPQYDDFFEERWLFEAILESYLPLLAVFKRLEADGVPFKFTLAVSPTLASMLADGLLKAKFEKYACSRLELARKEIGRTAGKAEQPLARLYLRLWQEALNAYKSFGGDLLGQFKRLAANGCCEIVASAATSCFLPLYSGYPNAVRAQIKAALASHKEFFGQSSQGFYLPHCGYYPQLEEMLKEEGVRYFFAAGHSLLQAENGPPRYGVYEPAETPCGVAVFGRDRASGVDVWHPQTGYPSDALYRDFYRDIGFDLPLHEISSFALANGCRTPTGIKYMAVTGASDKKKLYNAEAAGRRVKEHAAHFVRERIWQCKKLGVLMEKPPLVVSLYDAELFGHWWFEGPMFIEEVFRYLAASPLKPVTPLEYLSRYCNFQELQPVFSSWGQNGYGQVWLDDSNDWLVRHMFKAVERMTELADRFPAASGLKKRVLDQAARETLLAMSGDWPLMIRSGASREFAIDQIRMHLSNFYKIYEAMGRNVVRAEWLTTMEKQNNLFFSPGFSYKLFKTPETAIMAP